MAFWGYTKIPTEVVQLSMAQELFLEKMYKHESSSKGRQLIGRYLKGQKALTVFLRAGRLLNK